MAFTKNELDQLVELASNGISEIMTLQNEMLSVAPTPRKIKLRTE